LYKTLNGNGINTLTVDGILHIDNRSSGQWVISHLSGYSLFSTTNKAKARKALIELNELDFKRTEVELRDDYNTNANFRERYKNIKARYSN